MNLRQRFVEFWPLFIGTHLHPWNRRFHVAGNIVMFGTLALAAVSRTPWLVPLAFLGYLPSWLGHFFFEGNVPVTFKSPIISGLCDLKMIGLIASGTLPGELKRLFGSSNPAPGAPMVLTMEQEREYQRRLRQEVGGPIGEHPFSNYWDIFLLKHRNPWNIALHTAAMIYLYSLVAYVAFSHRYWLLAAIPLTQLVGLVGHAVFERSHVDFEDAIFSVRAFSSLNRMLATLFTGGYGSELRRVETELSEFRQAPGRIEAEKHPLW